MLIRRVKYRPVELIYFPVTTIIIWGLFAVYARELAAEAGLIVLIINIFWAFAHLAQVTSNVLMMEDIWSGSLKQILISGVSGFEYILSKLITSTLSAIVIINLMIALALAFGINFYKFNMLLLIILTLVSSLALALFVAAMIFYFGKEYGFLTWSVLQLFVLLSAPFFPKEIFPGFLQKIAFVMPFTAVFEAARVFGTGGVVTADLLWWALAVGIGYMIVGWPLFHLSFRRARKTGELARMY